MNPFRRAPWYLKLLLLFLPLVLCGKLFSYAMSVHAIASAEYTRESAVWLVTNGVVIAFVAVVSWFTWRPRPLTRWLVAAFMLLAIARTVYQWLNPWEPHPLLSGGQADGPPGSIAVAVTSQALMLLWAYVCVFSRSSLAFYGAAQPSRAG